MYSHFINIYVALILEKILYSSLADNLLHTTSFEKENEVSFSAIPHLDNTPKVCVCVCVCVCMLFNQLLWIYLDTQEGLRGSTLDGLLKSIQLLDTTVQCPHPVFPAHITEVRLQPITI